MTHPDTTPIESPLLHEILNFNVDVRGEKVRCASCFLGNDLLGICESRKEQRDGRVREEIQRGPEDMPPDSRAHRLLPSASAD